MFAVFKSQAALPNQFQKELVDHAGRLQQVLGSLASKERSGNLPELRVDKLEKVLNGRRIPCAPIAKKYRDFSSIRHADLTLIAE
jgi:hypothetical protein